MKLTIGQREKEKDFQTLIFWKKLIRIKRIFSTQKVSLVVQIRGIFRTLSSVYDGAPLLKWLAAFSCYLFCKKATSWMFDRS